MVSNSDALKRAAAKWILKIKEKHKISQVAMESIIEHVTDLFQIYLSDLHNVTKAQLRNSQVSDEIILSLDPVFDVDGQYGRPFKGLESEYRQLKYFKEKFAMVVRVTIFNNVIITYMYIMYLVICYRILKQLY